MVFNGELDSQAKRDNIFVRVYRVERNMCNGVNWNESLI